MKKLEIGTKYAVGAGCEKWDSIDSITNFFLRPFLQARKNLNMESNQGYIPEIVPELEELEKMRMRFSEDVNAYIAQLLVGVCGGATTEMMSKLVSGNELEIKEMVDDAESRAKKYLIYKTNADYLLVSMGVFEHFSEEKPKESNLVRGKRYYSFASGYLSEIKKTSDDATVFVLKKLARDFPDYVEILSAMSHLAFEKFAQKITDDDISKIIRLEE